MTLANSIDFAFTRTPSDDPIADLIDSVREILNYVRCYWDDAKHCWHVCDDIVSELREEVSMLEDWDELVEALMFDGVSDDQLTDSAFFIRELAGVRHAHVWEF